MKLRSLILFSFLLLTFVLNAQGQKFHLLIGNNEGIHVYEFNSQTGELTYKTKNIENSSGFLAVAPDRKHVYSTGSGSNINSYIYDLTSGELTFLNKQPSGGSGPAYVSIDATGKYVFSANYGSGSVSALPVQKDGSLGADIQVIKHEGSSINKTRQTKPYVHSVVVSPDNHYLFAQDLGTDKINIYRFDPKKSSPLSPSEQAFMSVTPGSGPRHLIFHPNKKFVYVIHEMGGLISGYTYKEGKITPIETLSIDKAPLTEDSHAADIQISPDGKFLYGSNRGVANELVIYSIDQKTGKLTFLGRQSTFGKRPVNFKIDPTGNFLLVANTDTDSIIVFKRDKETGLLTPTGQKLEISRPTSMQIVRID